MNVQPTTDLVSCLNEVQTQGQQISETRKAFDADVQKLQESEFVMSMRNLLASIRS